MNALRNFNSNDAAALITTPPNVRLNHDSNAHRFRDTGGLSSFHRAEKAEEGSNRGRLIGSALVVALLLGAAGIYAYTGSGSTPAKQTMAAVQPKAPAASVPSNAMAPIQTAPVTPPAATPADVASNASTAKSPYDAAPAASTSASDNGAASDAKPVKTGRAHIRMGDANQTAAESEQTTQLNRSADRATANGSVAVPLPSAPASSVAATVTSSSDNAAAGTITPLPNPPAPPASSVASTQQPVMPQSDNTAQDIPAAPAVTPTQTAPAAPVNPAPQTDQAAQPQAQPQ